MVFLMHPERGWTNFPRFWKNMVGFGLGWNLVFGVCMNKKKLVGVLGCHVDDLLVGGSGSWYDSRIRFTS